MLTAQALLQNLTVVDMAVSHDHDKGLRTKANGLSNVLIVVQDAVVAILRHVRTQRFTAVIHQSYMKIAEFSQFAQGSATMSCPDDVQLMRQMQRFDKDSRTAPADHGGGIGSRLMSRTELKDHSLRLARSLLTHKSDYLMLQLSPAEIAMKFSGRRDQHFHAGTRR